MKYLLSRFKQDERGLTLVELLAVVVILAIVAAIAFIMIGNVIENTKKDAHIANAQQVISGVKLGEATGDVSFNSVETAGTTVNAMALELLGNMVEPWEKTNYGSATVTKVEGVYSISLRPELTEHDDKCPIINKTERQLQEGREEACRS